MSNNTRNNNSKKNNGSNRGRSNNSGRNSSTGRNSSAARRNDTVIYDEYSLNPWIPMLIISVICIFVFLSIIGILGDAGEHISNAVFGIFGMPAYVLPILIVVIGLFIMFRSDDPRIVKRIWAGSFIYVFLSILMEMLNGVMLDAPEQFDIKNLWNFCSTEHKGGGIIFGSIAYFMNKYLSRVGTIALLVLFILICVAFILGKDALYDLSRDGRDAIKGAKDNAAAVRQAARERAERADREDNVYEDKLPRYAMKRRGIGVGLGKEPDKTEDENESVLPRINGEELKPIDKTQRINKKVSGVMQDAVVGEDADRKRKSTFDRDDMHEISVRDINDETDKAVKETAHATSGYPFDGMNEITFNKGGAEPDVNEQAVTDDINSPSVITAAPAKKPVAKPVNKPSGPTLSNSDLDLKQNSKKAGRHNPKAYKMPSLDLLQDMKSGKDKGSSKEELLDKAKILQDTLETFGVKAKVMDISQGPSVTRFELQPETGVRVNKIVSLADDLKLSLAAMDIRIEAPIPGKSAVGIEVPNKESVSVGLKELLADKAFKNSDSKLSFGVGKDIAGKTIVADIAKMPHMLIAGATGSGKSVCINTIIMSLLYKAHPDDVKLIMIDPKVVELSVYNGIPHLMVPVVTDPKKASATLNWAVAEMTDRYKKFADMNVRDLKGYNARIDSFISSGKTVDDEGNEIYRLPQIVIIVDELADLMMVAAKEVEESICRIAQLARACGIHLIIATQRPSVDVITGLIKANMPSRVAFAVSSGVDSRTILDMNGAEKLLGKGDMLFFPQGYPKPARIQGAFVSDAEVGRVVKFLKDQDYVGIQVSDIENKINNISSLSPSSDNGGADEIDSLFADAGRFIIGQDKASIGSLQRKFKIGFNRAARIMDQLAEAGVVSEDNGTKPREVMMSVEQFEQYIEESV